jgi:hypothetical protein
MLTTRAQWPHTIDDIRNSLDGIWGLVGATATNGNLMRLERSLHQPLIYTVTEYQGTDESKVVRKKTFSAEQKDEAVSEFACAIGF